MRAMISCRIHNLKNDAVVEEDNSHFVITNLLLSPHDIFVTGENATAASTYS